MSGMKKTGSAGGSASKPVQSNNMFSYFGKSASTTPPKPTVGAAPTATATTPTTASSSTAAAPMTNESIAANFFSSAKPPQPTPSKLVAQTMATTPTTPNTTIRTPSKPTPSATAATPTSATSSTTSPQYDTSLGGRKRKVIQYNENDGDEDDEDRPIKSSSGSKKTKVKQEDDEYEAGGGGASSSEEEVEEAASEEEEERKSAPKARASNNNSGSKKKAPAAKKPTSASKKKSASTADDEDGGMDDADDFMGGGEGAASSRGGKAYNTDFLLPERRMDLQKRKPGQPGYDPTTLYIPPDAFADFTPAEKQYWEIKQRNMDLTLFFKIGKFYEMFDEDAAVGVKELGLSYMVNQKRPHAGFPEAGLAKYASQLVALGYKVGQVDQTESVEEFKAANASASKGNKRHAVRRELSSVLTPGTLVDGNVLNSDDANYLLALTERELTEAEILAQKEKRQAALQQADKRTARTMQDLEDHSDDCIEIGFTFADCTTGRFVVGQHRDDKQRSFLKTLLGFVNPKEVCLPRGQLSPDTLHVLQYELRQDVVRNELEPKKDFWNAERTINEIHAAKYYFDEKAPVEAGGGVSFTRSIASWPVTLQQLVGEKQELALSAFGAVVNYLRRTMHDHDLLSQRHVRSYFSGSGEDANRCLVLDGQTMANLEIVKNQYGQVKGTLLQFIDYTATAFGKRQLRDWLQRPLFAIDAITQRQDAVEYFLQHPELSDRLRAHLKRLPDLERGLSRIHANGLKKKMNVIMYENVTLKQLEIFLKTLDGFVETERMLKAFTEYVATDSTFDKSSRLGALLTHKSDGGLLPDFEDTLRTVRASFNPKVAKEQHKLVPTSGTFAEYEQCQRDLDSLRGELEAYLSLIKRQFNDSNIKWVHRNKEKYQLEIPIKTAEKGVPSSFEYKSGSKQCKRYWTKTSIGLAERFAKLELDQELLEKDMSRMIFSHFAEKYQLWTGTIEVVAELDCLLSLASVARNHQGCIRPSFVPFEVNGGTSKLELRNAVHPTLYEQPIASRMKSTNTYIANDTILGCAENPQRFVLVSGPNMGGKSTLLRQTCCAVILAQMGCWVPAEKCELTPIDRIFTRVGANDKIMQGHSTFHVELLETSHILKNATNRSLVILDELGRGTSTFDGTAIAYAVIRYLSEKTDCLTLFATHYHMIMDEFKGSDLINMYHMACQVNSDETDVTFLYKFIRGVCPKSYGGNVAKAAGLPERVLKRSQQMSENFEKRCVEAMGRNRARLQALYPPQSLSSDPSVPLSLPAATQNEIGRSIDTMSLEALFDLKMKFELCAKKHEQQATQKKVKLEQQQQSEQDTEMKAIDGEDYVMV